MKYPPQDPVDRPGPPDATRQLLAEDGVLLMPCSDEMVSARSPGESDGRYLWVILPDAVPVILETAPDATPPLDSGFAKHTNLTGGGPACCGGEVWLDEVDDHLLHVNGGSGRYPPRDPDQLDDATEVFEQLGYRVNSAGWDEDVDLPARRFRK